MLQFFSVALAQFLNAVEVAKTISEILHNIL